MGVVRCCWPRPVALMSSRANSATVGEQGAQSASDAEFRATFSLLPHVKTILTTLNQGDHTAVEKSVGEFEFQLHRCHRLLANCPYLDLSTEEQREMLHSKRKQLQGKSDLLMNYNDLAVLTTR